jgi:hypothetical protein
MKKRILIFDSQRFFGTAKREASSCGPMSDDRQSKSQTGSPLRPVVEDAVAVMFDFVNPIGADRRF